MARDATRDMEAPRRHAGQALDRAAEVVISALETGGAERFALTEVAARRMAAALEELLAEDAMAGRTEGLLDLVRLAQTLEHKLESTGAARRLRSILRASSSARAVFEHLEGRHAGFRASCAKVAGTARRLPALSSRPREASSDAEDAGRTIRAALLMTPGELEARRARPSFTVQRLRAAMPLPKVARSVDSELPRFAVTLGLPQGAQGPHGAQDASAGPGRGVSGALRARGGGTASDGAEPSGPRMVRRRAVHG